MFAVSLPSPRPASRSTERPTAWPIAAAALAFCWAASATALAETERQLAALDGRRFPAQLISYDPGGKLVFRVGTEEGTLPADELFRWGQPEAPRHGPLVVMAGDGWLVADVISADSDTLQIRSHRLGLLAIPLEIVQGIAFEFSHDPARRDALLNQFRDPSELVPAEGKGGLQPPPPGDAPGGGRLWLDNGDRLAGQVIAIDEQSIRVQSAAGPLELDRGSIQAVAFGQVRREPPAPAFLVALDDGSLIGAAQVRLQDRAWTFEIRPGVVWRTEPSDEQPVCGLEMLGGRFRYLSDLPPASYRHIPFLDLQWPYRLDRTVTGQRMRVGGRLFPKGVGMHSTSRLTWRLDDAAAQALGALDTPPGGWRRFRARLAIDDEAGQGGSVVGRVFLDSELAFTSPVIRGGDSPVEVDVPLGSARTISLVVDSADRGDQQDHADWLDARLER